VAFFAGGSMKKIDAFGGPVQSLCDAPEGRGGSWNRDGTTVFAPSIRTPLSQVSDAGGTPVAITKFASTEKTLDRADIVRLGSSHRWPYFLPDGHHFLLFARGTPNGIYAGAIGSDEIKFLLQSDSNAIYSPTGHLVWWRDGALVAQPFDADRLLLSGNASPVEDRVLYSTAQSVGAFSVSQNGILVFQGGEQNGREPTFGANQLAWLDRSGKQVGTIGERDLIFNPRISPDGKRIAVEIGDYQGLRSDIWIYELSRGVRTRFTLSQSASYAVWSPDSSRIAFTSEKNGHLTLLVKSSSGTSGEEILLDEPGGRLPWSWSADGRFIAYAAREPNPAKDKFDIWILPLFGEKKPSRLFNPTITKAGRYSHPTEDGSLTIRMNRALQRFMSPLSLAQD
jgi:eukaryotic-like serine/threonine-protein kinase